MNSCRYFQNSASSSISLGIMKMTHYELVSEKSLQIILHMLNLVIPIYFSEFICMELTMSDSVFQFEMFKEKAR